jgi:hypothetical protein
MRRIAVLSGLVLLGGLLGPSTAFATGRDEHADNQDRWIADISPCHDEPVSLYEADVVLAHE